MAKRSLLLSLLLSLGVVGAPTTSNGTQTPQCRCMPGDPCWPSVSDWAAFNNTLGGKLIASIPYPYPCHDSSYGSYNASECANIQSTFFWADGHLKWPSSIMASYFTNGSCDPWSAKENNCAIGNYVEYSVNASSPEDFQKVMNFTTSKNIRLVIKNTGHDYNGKGTGAGGVAIWTHYMKKMEIVDSYSSPNYTGKAIKMGAGVEVHELYEFAHANGLVAVGGLCPSVGVAGGYTQGGGHGPLASRFGLGADNALEWEVVTGTGELVVANATSYSDLNWALSGGGGGTFGVVSSLTVKAYPDMNTSAANLTFTMKGHEDEFWETVEIFQQNLPTLVDAGAGALWYIADGTFSIMPAIGFDIPMEQLRTLFNATLSKLNETGIDYEFDIRQFDSFLSSYNAMVAPWNVSQSMVGGRLIPRTLVEDNATALIDAIKLITNTGATISGVCLNVNHSVPSPDSNAVNPYWRRSIYDAVLGKYYNYTDWSVNKAAQDNITDYLLPPLEKLTPDGGAYLNEADFQQPDYQRVFYGDHYERLKQIKEKYDPNDIFYAITAVGSDGWYEDQSQGGRLCRKPENSTS